MTFKLDLTSDSNHDYFDLETALSSFGSYESVINSFKQRLYGFTRSNVLASVPCPPLAIERYRNLVWAPLGDKSCNSILERISASPDVSTQNHWLLFVNELLTSYPHLSSHSPTSINLDSSSYAYLPVIFDSIYFFISGGYFTYYECIKALYSLDKGVLIIVLVDYNMILFPELVELIHSRFPNLILLDVSRSPIYLTKRIRALFSTVSVAEPQLALLQQYTFKHNNVCSPEIFIQNNRSVSSLDVCSMDFVWSDSFTKDESRLIVQDSFHLFPFRVK